MNKGGTACKTERPLDAVIFFVEGDDDMQLVLAQVSDAEALQRYEDVCKDAEETDVLPFRLQYADMSAFSEGTDRLAYRCKSARGCCFQQSVSCQAAW